MSNNSETVSGRCDEIVAKHNLLKHTFYRRWTDGTLPVPALKDYAREYGMFIRTIRKGWEKVGKPEIADVEDGHAQVWEESFAASLGTTIEAPRVKEVEELVAVSNELFGNRASALGALYAFEAQQPVIAQAKVEGLSQHYRQLPKQCGDYFRLHCEDYGEAEFLSKEMNALNEDERETAVTACERMGQTLYNALTGIETPYLRAGFGKQL